MAVSHDILYVKKLLVAKRKVNCGLYNHQVDSNMPPNLLYCCSESDGCVAICICSEVCQGDNVSVVFTACFCCPQKAKKKKKKSMQI